MGPPQGAGTMLLSICVLAALVFWMVA